MGYLESSDAELIALTRLRREQLARRVLGDRRYQICDEQLEAFRYGGVVETLRHSATGSFEFARKIAAVTFGGRASRRRSSYRGWRTGQFHAGDRSCYYCSAQMVLPLRKREGFVCLPNTATVDHKTPLARGGADAPHNWVMCCSACNNWKADMTEEEFRAVREAMAA